MRRSLLKTNLIFTITFLVVTLDQASKAFARRELLGGVTTKLIPGLIQLRLVKNTGAAFSLFKNSTSLLAILSLIVSTLLIFWLIRIKSLHFWEGIAGAFLLGGTIGNGIDRWLYKEVTDFLEIIPINFPIFNVADIAINIAVICFAINTLRMRQKKQQI
ncbi:signal peptidase II [Prochlorococcus sp. MIT 1341]|uniref:signal peptidase II n=1 Tax=Prochlorococcus sp. MIT 1341 TaxID=3096221 RepID=UPI002A7666B1|nr:signal peptidase II [Prochlorococcus sp. MIT 1341]